MSWLLVGLLFIEDQFTSHVLSKFNTYEECLEARTYVMQGMQKEYPAEFAQMQFVCYPQRPTA